MYTEKQIDRALGKLKRLENMLEPHIFKKVDEMEVGSFLTDGSWHEVPDESHFSACERGTKYEGEGIYVWVRGTYQVPEHLEGQTLFIWPKVQAYEGMLWVNGKPYGNFANKYAAQSHGNHYCDMLVKEAKAGERIEVAIEFYAHHQVMGTQPFDDEKEEFKIVYDGMDICVREEELLSFYYNLKIANQMTEALEKNNFRRLSPLCVRC